MVRVFTDGLGGWGSISGRVIPKAQKMVLDAFLFKPPRYKVRIKSKWSNPGKRVAPSSTPRCSSYWKASLGVIFDNSRTIYIYINNGVLQKWLAHPILTLTNYTLSLEFCKEIFVYNLPRLLTTNNNRFDLSGRNYNRRRLLRWYSGSCKYVFPSRIPVALPVSSCRRNWPHCERK